MKERGIEFSTQTPNALPYDANYLEMRLGCSKLHMQILDFLEGKLKSLKYNEKTEAYEEVRESLGTPLANPIGIQILLSIVSSIVTPQTLLGNKTKDEYNQLMYNICEALSDSIGQNSDYYGIDKVNRKIIYKTLKTLIDLALSRTIDNKERETLFPSIEKVSKYYAPDEKKKVI